MEVFLKQKVKIIFKKVLGYDLTKDNKDLFFTNMACCYRNDKL